MIAMTCDVPKGAGGVLTTAVERIDASRATPSAVSKSQQALRFGTREGLASSLAAVSPATSADSRWAIQRNYQSDTGLGLCNGWLRFLARLTARALP